MLPGMPKGRTWYSHSDALGGMQEAVNVSLANLLTFPFIEERVRAGKLHIYGMHYDFTKGKLTSWEIEREGAALPA